MGEKEIIKLQIEKEKQQYDLLNEDVRWIGNYFISLAVALIGAFFLLLSKFDITTTAGLWGVVIFSILSLAGFFLGLVLLSIWYVQPMRNKVSNSNTEITKLYNQLIKLEKKDSSREQKPKPSASK